MNVLTRFVLPLAAVIFGLLLAPRAAQAQAVNCPVEPKTNVPIVSGEVYAGTNCVLHTPGDVDTFVFNGKSGDTWQLAAAYQGGQSNICMTLYDPNGKIIFPNSTNSTYCTLNGSFYREVVVDEQTLTLTGQYIIAITEPPGGGQAVSPYALSLERINPFPPEAKPIALASAVTGDITPSTDQNAYTFYATTTGEYQVSLTFLGGSTNVCVYLYVPGSATPAKSPDQGCTLNGQYETYQFQYAPSASGYYMLLVNGQGNYGSVSYTLEVSCVPGTTCEQPLPPPCTLKDALSYNATTSTLTMQFTVGNTAADTWNAWLTYETTMKLLFSSAQPVTNPPVVVPKTTSLAKEGMVGVLSTLTNSTKGIVCASYQQINTGTP